VLRYPFILTETRLPHVIRDESLKLCGSSGDHMGTGWVKVYSAKQPLARRDRGVLHLCSTKYMTMESLQRSG
jgi:hypothetical protein